MQPFNQHAKTYNQYAMAQRIAAEILVESLPEEAPQTILELGAGTGLFTQHLQQRYPNAEITAIDSSAEMLTQCSADRKNVCSIENYTGSADLIVSSLALQWVKNPEQILQKYQHKNIRVILVTQDSFPEWGFGKARQHLPTVVQFQHLNFKQQVISKTIPYKNKAAFLKSLKYTGAYKAADAYTPISTAKMRQFLQEREPFKVTWRFLLLSN